MGEKTTKVVEMVLAACCLAVRYNDVHSLTSSHIASPQKFSLDDLVTCVAYFGYLFLITVFALAAISGETPTGTYMIFFNVCGAVLYACSELAFYTDQWTLFTMFGLGAAICLIVILILDCLSIRF